ncbi:hypothetical protein [Sphingomonas sp. PB1R3]|uniref:hypothetical protein n=1 Tax=Sphingomonas flavida TaxID=3096154 RepID=UPI002FC5D629
MSNRLGKFVAVTLVVAATAYTLVMEWLVYFTIAFFGFADFGTDPFGFAALFLMAVSPLPIWWYCLKRAAVWLRGERRPL